MPSASVASNHRKHKYILGSQLKTIFKMKTDQAIMEELVLIKGEESVETVNIGLEKPNPPTPSWVVHQVMKYLLPALKD